MTIFSDVKRVMFDLDGTLIKHNFEKENLGLAAHFGLQGNKEFRSQLQHMFATNIQYIRNRKVSKEYFARIIEKTMPILETIGVSGLELLETIDMYHSGVLMDNAKEILGYLQEKGYEIVAFTNWFYSCQLMILKRLGIAEYFERIYAWDDYFAKPNRYAMLRALNNTEPNENVLIGDSTDTDVAYAKKFGVWSIGFNVDYEKYNCKVKADVDITDLIEIKKYL